MKQNSTPEVLLTDENRTDGVLVVCLPGNGPEQTPARRGFFFDNRIDRGPTLERFIQWFDLWGIRVNRLSGTDTAFERTFFSMDWPSSASVLAGATGPQQVPRIAAVVDELKTVLAERQPKLVIFLSCYLWQAVNTIEAREALEPIIGAPLETGRRITSMRMGAFFQHWEKINMLALPMPSTTTTDPYVISLASSVQDAFLQLPYPPTDISDPLLSLATEHLVIDTENTVTRLKRQLHITDKHAFKLMMLIQERYCNTQRDGTIVLQPEKLHRKSEK